MKFFYILITELLFFKDKRQQDEDKDNRFKMIDFEIVFQQTNYLEIIIIKKKIH